MTKPSAHHVTKDVRIVKELNLANVHVDISLLSIINANYAQKFRVYILKVIDATNMILVHLTDKIKIIFKLFLGTKI